MAKQTFLVEETKKRIEGAGRFGKTRVLFPQACARPAVFQDEFLDDVARRLRLHSFDPKRDSLIYTGQTVLLGMVLGVIMSQYGRANVLFFNSTTNKYEQRSF